MVALLVIGQAVAAPPTTSPAATAGVTSGLLESKIKESQADTSLEEATKTRLLELYRKALSQLEKASSFEAAAASFAKARQEAPRQAEVLRAELDKAPKGPPTLKGLGVSEASPLPDLEQALVKEGADLAALDAKVADLDKQSEEQAGRPDAARKRLTELKQIQGQIDAELKVPSAEGEPPALTQARQWSLETQRNAVSAEIHALDSELLSHPMRVSLLKAQRDRTARSRDNVAAGIALLNEVVNQRRRAEAEQAQAEAAAAEREAAGKHPLLGELAKQNAALSQGLSAVAGELEKATAQEASISQRSKQIEDDYRRAKQRLEIGGLSEALGRVLLELRRQLPDVRQAQREAALRQDAIVEAGLRQVRYAEDQRRLSDLDAATREAMSRLPEEEQAQIRNQVRELLKSRRSLLEQATATDTSYLRALGELDFAQRRLLDLTREYDAFLGEHLLWTPSAQVVGLDTFTALPAAIAWLLSPSGWLEAASSLVHDTTHSPALVLVIGLLGVLLWNVRRLRAAMRATGEKVGKPTQDSLGYTFQAFGIMVLLAVPWPLLVAAVGWRLSVSLEAAEFTKAVGKGLSLVAPAFLNLQAFRVFCEPGGIAAAHFGWSEHNLQLLRRGVFRLMVMLLPTGFIAATLRAQPEVSHSESLGRLAFVVIMVVLGVFFQRVFNPRSGVFTEFFRRHPASRWTRSRYAWYALIIAVPVGMAGLSLGGYMYAAGVLIRSLVSTLWLSLGLVVLHDMVVRWLALTRRRLALKAAREKREAAKAAAGAQEEEGAAAEGPALQLPEETMDLEALDVQTRKLLNTALVVAGAIGLWLIWSGVLPAFRILDDVALWYQTATVGGEEKRVPVTLADVVLAVIIGIVTTVAAKNLPALLEIAVLSRFKSTAGGRYTVTTLSRYTIVAIGVLLVFNTIGGSWGQIQWLVAALSVGIGFGLQEIVANFISGLIILFERPVRVGDIVTVGDTTGVVSRIRIRATTITNWDKQELLVPNKEFITGRLLNWSLSDQMNRIVITIGVAYGTDVRRALDLMAAAALEHPRILNDPKPVLTFEGFGDNALNLLMRCYLDSLEFRLATISELHEAINQKFNQAGLVIAFPQRDVHLDATRPIEVRVVQATKGGVGDQPAGA
jgi:potassium efflux system protein